jgi:hypothetical protein
MLLPYDVPIATPTPVDATGDAERITHRVLLMPINSTAQSTVDAPNVICVKPPMPILTEASVAQRITRADDEDVADIRTFRMPSSGASRT